MLLIESEIRYSENFFHIDDMKLARLGFHCVLDSLLIISTWDVFESLLISGNQYGWQIGMYQIYKWSQIIEVPTAFIFPFRRWKFCSKLFLFHGELNYLIEHLFLYHLNMLIDCRIEMFLNINLHNNKLK